MVRPKGNVARSAVEQKKVSARKAPHSNVWAAVNVLQRRCKLGKRKLLVPPQCPHGRLVCKEIRIHAASAVRIKATRDVVRAIRVDKKLVKVVARRPLARPNATTVGGLAQLAGSPYGRHGRVCSVHRPVPVRNGHAGLHRPQSILICQEKEAVPSKEVGATMRIARVGGVDFDKTLKPVEGGPTARRLPRVEACHGALVGGPLGG